jgi:hypothetical protein
MALQTYAPSANTLASAPWEEFVRTHLVARAGGRHFNRRPIQAEKWSRYLHRWLVEGSGVSFWVADEFLAAHGLHIEEFFLHCELADASPWARGVPPQWHS